MNPNESYVTIEHRSGAYIAKAIEQSQSRLLVEITAVVRHPLQGDLHHPYEADVPLFHERRAASNREKVWVPASSVEAYAGPVPSYEESLRVAWEEMVASTSKMAAADQSDEVERRPGLAKWAERSMEKLRELEKDYWG
jgi:kinase-associated protein B